MWLTLLDDRVFRADEHVVQQPGLLGYETEPAAHLARMVSGAMHAWSSVDGLELLFSEVRNNHDATVPRQSTSVYTCLILNALNTDSMSRHVPSKGLPPQYFCLFIIALLIPLPFVPIRNPVP